MFVFKIWGNFASFRDPITISQNLSLPLPPKTTVGGMMASILGISNYFEDEEYFDFGYSCIMLNEIRKKSFSQNYIEKYTSRVGTKITAYETAIKKYSDAKKAKDKLLNLREENKKATQVYKQLKMLNKKCKVLTLEIEKLENKKNETFTKPKPINRELILNPSYLIVIDSFKYEDKLIELLKKHYSIYPFYLGNSEFSGNFEYIESQILDNEIDFVDSFTSSPQLIDFEFEQKYSNMTMPLRVVGDRQYKEYKKIIFSDKTIKLKEKVKGLKLELLINNEKMDLGCEFI